MRSVVGCSLPIVCFFRVTVQVESGVPCMSTMEISWLKLFTGYPSGSPLNSHSWCLRCWNTFFFISQGWKLGQRIESAPSNTFECESQSLFASLGAMVWHLLSAIVFRSSWWRPAPLSSGVASTNLNFLLGFWTRTQIAWSLTISTHSICVVMMHDFHPVRRSELWMSEQVGVSDCAYFKPTGLDTGARSFKVTVCGDSPDLLQILVSCNWQNSGWLPQFEKKPCHWNHYSLYAFHPWMLNLVVQSVLDLFVMLV